MTYYEIDEDIARLAHKERSLKEYVEGQATAIYRAAVDKAAALVERQKRNVSAFYHRKLDSLLDSYAFRFAQWINDYDCLTVERAPNLRAGEFDLEDDDQSDALWEEYEEIKGILSEIQATGIKLVDLADPDARRLLTERLERYREVLQAGDELNAFFEAHQTTSGFHGLSPEVAAKLDKHITSSPSFIPKPYPQFKLTDLRNKIKRMQGQIIQLDEFLQHRQADNGVPPDACHMIYLPDEFPYWEKSEEDDPDDSESITNLLLESEHGLSKELIDYTK